LGPQSYLWNGCSYINLVIAEMLFPASPLASIETVYDYLD